jgi:CRP/FNR family cyclic AMP-dependent transcriptional regulator
MSTEIKPLPKDQYLFREGDIADALYILKSGKLLVLKSKGSAEISIAEIKPGEMIGELAFFDSKPRSASIKAAVDSEVVFLPIKNLQSQFQNFPEWAKALMRSISLRLRDANMKIKQLEKIDIDEEVLPPHLVSRLTSILTLVFSRYATPTDISLIDANIDSTKDEVEKVLNYQVLRDYTIRVFHDPTNKLDSLLEVFQKLNYLKIEENLEKQKFIYSQNIKDLFDFSEWFSTWLYKNEGEKLKLNQDEIDALGVISKFCEDKEANDQGKVKINFNDLTEFAKSIAAEKFKIDALQVFFDKNVLTEKQTLDTGVFTYGIKTELQKLYKNWTILQATKL